MNWYVNHYIGITSSEFTKIVDEFIAKLRSNKIAVNERSVFFSYKPEKSIVYYDEGVVRYYSYLRKKDQGFHKERIR